VILCLGSPAIEPVRRVRIKVFNQAGAPSRRVLAAEKKAALIFRWAGIAADWLDCSVDASGHYHLPECERAWMPADVELVITDYPGPHLSQFALGCSKPDPQDGYARIFYLRIQKEARERSMTESDVMALVIAHEIGHLLLRSRSHSRAGVMRARFGGEEWERARKNHLRFAPEQSSAMQETVTQLIRRRANAPLLARSNPPPARSEEVE